MTCTNGLAREEVRVSKVEGFDSKEAISSEAVLEVGVAPRGRGRQQAARPFFCRYRSKGRKSRI
jgi:hypothetical protein